jgi:tetratricopeptide (TPR) repeat protein
MFAFRRGEAIVALIASAVCAICLSGQASRADRIDYCPSSLAVEDTIARCTDTLRNPELSNEDRSDALYLRGWRFCNRRQYSDALADFDAAIKLMEPIDLDADRKTFKSEESAFSYDMFRSYGDFYIGRSCALAGLERFTEALDSITEGEGLFLSNKAKGHARTERALTYVRMGNMEKAATSFREAVSLISGSGENAIHERYQLAVVLLAEDKSDAVTDPFFLRDAIDSSLGDRKPAILLYVLGLLPPDETKKVLAKDRISLGGDGDILADYFAGRIDIGKLMAKPDDYSDVDQQDRLCVINFFLGESMLPKDKGSAIAYFQAAIATGSQYLPEYLASRAILNRLTAH